MKRAIQKPLARVFSFRDTPDSPRPAKTLPKGLPGMTEPFWLGPAALFAGNALAELSRSSLEWSFVFAAGAVACLINWLLDNRQVPPA